MHMSHLMTLHNRLDGDESTGKASWDDQSELEYEYYVYTIHVEIFPKDLISQLAICNSAVCTWVTNAPVAKSCDT